MHLGGHPELFWRRCGIWNRFWKFWVCRPTMKNVTGSFKKNWFSEGIHKITPDNMKPTIQMHLRGHPELFWRRCGIWNRFWKFCVCRPTIKKRHWHFKKIGFLKKFTKLHQITWNQLVRCTYGVILSCFEGAVAFGIDFENFAFEGQLSKNVTGSCKKIGFLKNFTKLHQITWNQQFRCTYGVILSCFEGAVAFGIDFENFAFAGQLLKNVTGTLKKNWFSEETHKITPDNIKPTGQMHLRGHPALFWRSCGIWNRFWAL